jgi:hypothetical protein
MDELNMKYLGDERNWFFQEKFSKQKVIENSVWPAQMVHQHQVRIGKKNYYIYSTDYLLKKDERSFYA